MKRVLPVLPVLWFLAVVAPAPKGISAELPDTPCFKCHQAQKKVFAEGNVHPPVAEGDCSACHADHGALNKLVLTEKVPQLCYGCHDQAKGKHVHPPVQDGECLLCHQIHNSPRKKLLAKGTPELCFECHDDFGKKHAVLHPPVADGECLECHKGHQSERDALLAKNYARERYVDYSKDSYELCFACHESKPFEDVYAADATSFRNGCTNLHFLHVVGKVEDKYGTGKINKKRIACNGCHLVHGSSQENMIRSSFERDKMTVYTIEFKKSPEGGFCVVGCHKPREYRKNLPEGVSQATPAGKCAPPNRKAALN